jgi:hypothetical protein
MSNNIMPTSPGTPSRPRAGRALRILVYFLMLALACGAIWFIDRGAMMTNAHPPIHKGK